MEQDYIPEWGKIEEWSDFAIEVINHIQQYVIPQYGEYPDEHIANMSIEEIKGKLSSYVTRIGKVQVNRGIEGALQDCYKIAHFACFLANKLREEEIK